MPTAILTGVTGGWGRAVLDRFVERGWDVCATTRNADADGLPAFSMRKVADRLGLKLMSIYTYVPGRSELIGLMVDEVTGEEVERNQIVKGYQVDKDRYVVIDEAELEAPCAEFPWDGVSGVRPYRVFAATTTVGVY